MPTPASICIPSGPPACMPETDPDAYADPPPKLLLPQMTITMRELALPRAFSFAVTDPRVDVDVSAQVMAYGYFEGHTFRIWCDWVRGRDSEGARHLL